MEQWQRDIIQANSAFLVANINPTTGFINELARFMNREELQQFGNPIRTAIFGQPELVSKVIGILETRLGGFDGLIEALRITNQTAALETLEEARAAYDGSNR